MTEKHQAHLHLLERLESQKEEVARLVSDLDEATIATRTVPEKWSVKEVLAHIARVQEVFETRLNAILEKEGAAIASYDPERDPEFGAISRKSAAELWKWFAETRGRIVSKLQTLSPADWHRKGHHPDYPVYDVHFCMEYMAHHEAHHMYQMFMRRPAGKTPH